MLIAVDAGNSHVRLGGYEEDVQIFNASIGTEPKQTADYYASVLKGVCSFYQIDIDKVTDAIISSVVPSITAVLIKALKMLFACKVMEVSSGTKTGLNIRLEQPKMVGTDRVIAAVAAKAHGKLPAVVVDCGTATSFTVLDENGVMVGSAITAGVCLSLGALRTSAAQLPEINIDAEVQDVLAKNTEDAMRVGAIVGAAAMIDGMVKRFEKSLGQTVCVVLTGGSAKLVKNHLETSVVYEKSLCLDGLYQIWKKNSILVK